MASTVVEPEYALLPSVTWSIADDLVFSAKVVSLVLLVLRVPIVCLKMVNNG